VKRYTILHQLGAQIISGFSQVGQFTLTSCETFRYLFSRTVRKGYVIREIDDIGAKCLPLTILAGFFSGMVIALQGGRAVTLVLQHAFYIAAGVSYAMVLEMGPVITGFMVAGRSGSATSAQLGSMKVTEQIDALKTMGISPVGLLVTPKLIAAMLVLPLLTLITDVSGVFGGFVWTTQALGMPAAEYWNEVFNLTHFAAVLHGMIKAFFFGIIIILVSANSGLQTEGGAEGVGKSVTRAVVWSLLVVLVSDYFLTAILNALKIY